MHYRVLGIQESVTSHVRSMQRDPVYKHPAHTETATGYGPCRQCLQFFKEGVEQRTLFTYDSFLGLDTKRQPGPVFIHTNECSAYQTIHEFPQHLTSHSLTFEGYGKGKQLRLTEMSPDVTAEEAIERCFARTDVDYIIVRDTDAGCFDCAIVRD